MAAKKRKKKPTAQRTMDGAIRASQLDYLDDGRPGARLEDAAARRALRLSEGKPSRGIKTWSNIAVTPDVSAWARRLAAGIGFAEGGGPVALGEVVAAAFELLEADLRRRKVTIPKASATAKGPKARRA